MDGSWLDSWRLNQQTLHVLLGIVTVMIIVGIALAIAAATLGTVSKQLIAGSEHYRKSWLFHLGAFLNVIVGPVVDASAYAFAPQVIVAPLACLDVVINAVTAPRTLHWQKERLTRAHAFAVLLVTVGAICTSVFAEVTDGVKSVHDLEKQLFFRPASLVYMGCELVLVLAILGSLRRGQIHPATRGISLGIVAGMLMGNVFFTKSLLSIVQQTMASGDLSAWTRPTPYVLLLATLSGPACGHLLMRKGLAEYKGVFMVTIFQGAHIAAACLSGCVVMEEMSGATWHSYLLYWFGVLLILGGLLTINTVAVDAQLASALGSESSELAPGQITRRALGSPARRRPGLQLSGMVVGSVASLNWRQSNTASSRLPVMMPRAVLQPPKGRLCSTAFWHPKIQITQIQRITGGLIGSRHRPEMRFAG